MISIYALANSFLKHSFKENIPITYKKLRYLLVLSQVIFYNKTDDESSKIIYKDCCSLSNFRELCSKQ